MSKNCNPFYDKFPGCEEHADNRSTLVAKDKKRDSKFVIENEEKHFLVKLRVDGCLIKDSDGLKCDYLILDCSNRIAYFVELKGQDLSTAIRQLQSAMETLTPRLKEFRFCCRIVTSKVVRATYQEDKEKLLDHIVKRYKSNIHKISDLVIIKNQELIEII